MGVTLWTALLLQLIAVLALRHRLGKTWLRRPVTLLVLASVLCDGVSQALLSFPSVAYWDTYRISVQQSYVDQSNLIMSAAMLAFTFCYLLARPERVMAVPEAQEVRLAARRDLDCPGRAGKLPVRVMEAAVMRPLPRAG
jgi:hypothetical protein